MRSLAIPLFIPSFFLFVGQGMLLPLIPIFAGSFTDSFALISVAIAAAHLGNLLSDIPVGVILSHVSNRSVMLFGCALLAVCSVGLALSESLGIILVIRFAAGLGLAAFFLSQITSIAEIVHGYNRGRVVSSFGGVMRIGMFVGPTLVGLAVSSLGVRGCIHLSGIMAFIAFLIVLLAPAPQGDNPSSSSKSLRQSIGSLKTFSSPLIASAAVGSLLLMLIRSSRLAIVPVYGAFALDLDVETVGFITGISGAIDMTLFPLAGFVMDKLGRKYAAIPSLLVMSVGMIMVALSGSAVMLVLAAAVLGLGNGLGSGAMMTLGTDLAPPQSRSEFIGAWRVIGGGGALAGPMMVGGFADLVGLVSASLVIAGVGAVSAVFFHKAVPETLTKDTG